MDILTNKQFDLIKDILYQESGITLASHKRQMVQNRIIRRLKDTPNMNIESYLARLSSDKSEEELANLINALTTNVTYFFREGHHFDHLTTQVMTLIQAGQRSIRIWSAGCSIGAEPYSAAMAISDALKKKNISADIKILATDIDTVALHQARAGIYQEKNIKGLSAAHLKTHFKLYEQDDTGQSTYQIAPHIRRMVSYNHLNLNKSEWPMNKAFHFIFCRNVLIYFDRDKQKDYVGRMIPYLADHGYLYLGHSEHAAIQGFTLHSEGQTTYQKINSGA